MDKIKVTVLGSCVTREMFNETRMLSVFDVSLYAFKVCPISIFDEPLNIPEDLIYSSPIAKTQALNFNFNTNKTLVSEIEKVNADFIFIDIYSLVNDSFHIIKFKDKETLVQLDWFSSVFTKINSFLKKNNLFLSETPVTLENIDKNKIFNELKKFANYLNTLNKTIIVVWPKLTTKYFDYDYQIKQYLPQTQESYHKKQKILDEFTSHFIKNLNSPKILKWNDDFTSRLINSDYAKIFKNQTAEPHAVHLLQSNYEWLASSVLSMLNIDYKNFYNKPLDYISYRNESVKNEYEKLKSFRDNNIDNIHCHINAYTNYLLTLNHHIIVFSGKGDISKNLRFWKNKSLLGITNKFLRWNVKENDNYIALIDTKNNFVYEKISEDKLSYLYQIPNSQKTIYIESSNLLSKIEFFNKDYSYNKNGLNFFIINLNTSTVVDFGTCNIAKDQFMLVESNFFNNFKTK